MIAWRVPSPSHPSIRCACHAALVPSMRWLAHPSFWFLFWWGAGGAIDFQFATASFEGTSCGHSESESDSDSDVSGSPAARALILLNSYLCNININHHFYITRMRGMRGDQKNQHEKSSSSSSTKRRHPCKRISHCAAIVSSSHVRHGGGEHEVR